MKRKKLNRKIKYTPLKCTRLEAVGLILDYALQKDPEFQAILAADNEK